MQTGKQKKRMSPDQLPTGQELCWWRAQTGELSEGGAATDPYADSALRRGYQDKRREADTASQKMEPPARGRPPGLTLRCFSLF